MIPQYVRLTGQREQGPCHPAAWTRFQPRGPGGHVAMGTRRGSSWQVLANAERVLAIDSWSAPSCRVRCAARAGTSPLLRALTFAPFLHASWRTGRSTRHRARCRGDRDVLWSAAVEEAATELADARVTGPARPFRDSAIMYGVMALAGVAVGLVRVTASPSRCSSPRRSSSSRRVQLVRFRVASSARATLSALNTSTGRRVSLR